jgi:hypothetical protein
MTYSDANPSSVFSRFFAAAFAVATLCCAGAVDAQPQGPKPRAQVKQDAPKKDAPKQDAQKKSEKKAEPRPAKKKEGEKKSEKKDEIEGVVTKELRDKGKNEVPRGNDPADIRAMRGAQAMLEVERKLSMVLKRMKVGGKTSFLPFEELDDWPYEDGFIGMPKRLKKWDKKRVAMAGFMLPIDTVENIKEFYLVKSLWSCCYGIPPDVNGLVKVSLKTEKGVDFHYDPILLVGNFKLEKEMDEDYCVAIYQLEAEAVRVIDVERLRKDAQKDEAEKKAKEKAKDKTQKQARRPQRDARK